MNGPKIGEAYILTAIIFSTIIFSCKKGDTGPPGNANVTATTYSVPTSSWAYVSPNYTTDLVVPALNASAQNSGAVEVFFTYTGTTWQAIPYTYYNTIPGSSNYFMNFTTAVGYVHLFWTYNTSAFTGSDPNTVFGATCQFKVVVIPPAAMITHPNVNNKNYNEVKAAYNLRD